MDAFGDQFLAGAALADDEHGPDEIGGAPRLLDGVEKRQRLADKMRHFLHPKY
jgi:hypothetical protein